MKKFTLIIFLTFFTTSKLFSQYDENQLRKIVATSSERELVVESSRMLQDGWFYHASVISDKLLEINPSSSNYNYRRAFIYLELSSDHISALPLLEKAALKISNNYDMYSPNEERAPTDALFHLGRCYHLSENINKAEEFYNRFLDETLDESPLIPKAKLLLKQCEVAKRNIASPRNYRVKNIGNVVNTKAPEYSPVISLDGSAIYYTSRRKWEDSIASEGVKPDPINNFYPEDIYVSYKDFDNTWMTPFKLDFCAPDQNEATIAVSPDEGKIYVYQDISGGGDIYFSDFRENKFEDLRIFKARKVNTKYWETHCTVTPDGTRMFFTSDRPEGLGGRDIYYINKNKDGSWSEPINMGPTINTKYDEESPFIAIDNKTLYFSHNGLTSMGGFDVFQTKLGDDGKWSEPENLGYPLNSCHDDVFYTTTVDGFKGYLSSFRKNGFGEKDIYEIENDFLGLNQLAIFKGKIKTVDNMPLPNDLAINVKCLDCSKDSSLIVLPNKRNGLFYRALQPCHRYELIFSYGEGKELKEFYTDTVKTSCSKLYDEIYREVLLDTRKMEMVIPKKPTPPVEEPVVLNNVEIKIGDDLGKIININPIYFDYDKFNIRPDAAIELDKIVKIMNEYPAMEIELGSHTDCRGKMVYNDWLSSERAKSSAAYIRERISNPERIYGKGYGERKLLTNCPCEGKVKSKCSEEEHQMNRRTEFVIIKLN